MYGASYILYVAANTCMVRAVLYCTVLYCAHLAIFMHTVWAVAMIMGGDVACAEIARSSNTDRSLVTLNPTNSTYQVVQSVHALSTLSDSMYT